MKFGSVLALPSIALNTAATALRLLAAVNEAIAERIAGATDTYRDPVTPRPTQPEQAQPAGAAAPAEPAQTTTAARTAPPAEAGAQAAAEQTPPTPIDLAHLVTRNAPQVIAALDGLSSTELADLYEIESRQRRRATVLTAIEAAAAPPAAASDPDEVLLLDDVREPNVLVHSTVSAKRSGG